ncbi:PRC-barrel domain-containing protein [Marinibaculum pumilum]|uniref:PRC-barrel domain-containing protein n=1 Tax=Marinibaculum pumilum TaxID=1766165 RepID=A0ABV7KX22_9PROT
MRTRTTVMAMLAATALTVPGLAAAQQNDTTQGRDMSGMSEISCSEATSWMKRAVAQSEGLTAAERRQARQSLKAARDTDSRRECMQHVRAAHDVFAEVEAALILFDTDGKAFARTRDSGRTVTAAAGGGQIVVKQPEPQVSVETPDPQVTVDQKRPQVTVRQPKPEVVVRQQKPTINVQQPAPIVTVQQAQPDVTVNIPKPVVEIEMPEPDVDVASVEPQVRVRQPKPTIRFVRPEPEVVVQESEAQVEVDAARPQVKVSEASNVGADVTVDQAKPEVRFESGGDPNVDVEQGEAKVRVTGADEADVQVQQEKAEVRIQKTADSDRNMQRQQQSADAGERDRQQAEMRTERERVILVMQQHPMYGARVDEIVGDDVYSAEGEDVGDVERMAISGDRIYAIVGVGGILGLGDREVALPINRLAFADDRVTLPRLTEQDLESMPDIDMERYREIPMQRTLRQAYEAR